MFIFAIGFIIGAFVMWCWMDSECDKRLDDDIEEDM